MSIVTRDNRYKDPPIPLASSRLNTYISTTMNAEPVKIDFLIAMNRSLMPIGFFIFLFLFILLYIDPRVIYSCNGFDLDNYVRLLHSQAPTEKEHLNPESFTRHFYILELTGTFLKDMLSAPGGLNHVLVTHAIYACHYPIAGATALACFAWLLFFLFRVYVRGNGGIILMAASYLPPLFVLMMCSWYDLNYLAYVLPVLGALLASVIYQRLSFHPAILRLLTFSVLFWLTYYFFQWSCLLFIILAAIHAAFKKPKTLFSLASASILNAGVAYLIENFFLSPEKAFNLNEFFKPLVLPIIIIGFSPFISIAFNPAAIRFLFRRSKILSVSSGGPSAIGSAVQACILVLTVIGITAWAMNDPTTIEIRTMSRTLHHIQFKEWNKVLRDNNPAVYTKFALQNRVFMIHAINRALFNSGQLGSKMYCYPQAFLSPEPLLLLENTTAYGYPNWFAALDLLMDLGALNYAEKIAGETMENMGPYPFLIYRRAVIQLAKGNSDAASVYFGKLSRMPFYCKEARMFLAMLHDDAAIASYPLIARLRACMDTTGNLLYLGNEETILLDLLKSNPLNKMAYEYLMAYYLQTGNMEKIAEHIYRAADLGYTVLPRHWGEALCFYLVNDSTRTDRLRDLPLRPETFTELNRFLEAYNRGFNKPARMSETAHLLEKEFGTTYFYYLFKIGNGAK